MIPKHHSITQEEMLLYGVEREWNESIAHQLQPNATVLWVHTRRTHYTSLLLNDPRLIRLIKVTKVDEHEITTIFGKYSLKTGRNIHTACGCKRFCDCYGRLYLPSKYSNN